MSSPTKIVNGVPTGTALVSGDIPNNAANTSGTSNNVTGTVAPGNGGTGDTTYTAYGLLAAGTTSTGIFQQVSGTGTSAQVLTSNGPGALPTWQNLGAGSYTAPSVSIAYSAGIGTGGFATNTADYGYAFTITSASAVAGDVYQSSATVTISNASPAVITTPIAHNLQLGMPVLFATTGSLPSPLVAGTTYYVSVVAAVTTFQVAIYPGGPSINTTTAGSGTQTLLYGSYTVTNSTSSSPLLITEAPMLANALPNLVTNIAVTPANVLPMAPPTTGTLARLSGSGPATITFSNAQFYNSTYGSLFTITAATASAGDVYQDTKAVTITVASPAVCTTSVAHGLIVGTPVTFSTTGALPTGLAINTTYYVSAVPAVTTFQVSTTQGGASLNTSGTQSGTQTVNMSSFTVATGGSITNFTQLFTTQSNGYQPGLSGTLTKISGNAGSSTTITYSLAQPLGTYIVPTSPRSPLYIEQEIVGGGGSGASTGANGNAGTGSVFGTFFVNASGGGAGALASVSGIGGIPHWNVSPWTGNSYITPIIMQQGSQGSSGYDEAGGGGSEGGDGGSSPFAGGGGGSVSATPSYAMALPNTGSGGGGLGTYDVTAGYGGGGSAGAYMKFIITQTNLTSTYLYAVGSGGAIVGGAGGSGTIIIKEFYQ